MQIFLDNYSIPNCFYEVNKYKFYLYGFEPKYLSDYRQASRV